jgi:alkylhydroperoxidase family enzyme
VLQYAEEVTREVKVKEETFSALKQYLDEQSIVELTISVGYWGLVARVLVPLQVDLDVTTASSTQDLTGRSK